MLDKTRNILALISLISFVYVLRDSQTSPGTFLSHKFSRMLDNSTVLSDTLCDGVDRNDAITTSEQDRAEAFRSSINNVRNGNPLVDFINGPFPSSELGSEYLLPVLRFGVPWLVFLVISLLGCLYFLINWCCMYACSGGIQCCKAPPTRKCKNCYLVGSVVFMFATLAVGIAGLVVGAGFPKAGKETICSTAIFVEKLLQGSQSDRWVGADPAAQKLITVIDNLHPVALSLLNPTVVAGPFASAAYGTTDTLLTTFVTNNANKDVKRGDPTITTNYKPIYIQNINTEAGAIRTELQAKNTLLTGIMARLAADTAGLEATGVLSSFINLRDIAVNMSRTASDIRDNLIEGGSRGRRAFNGIGGGMLGVFAAKMFFAILSMVSILLVARGAIFFNKVIHVSWCCIGILVILGWVLSTILFPLNVVLFEVCDVMERIQVEPVFFNRTFDKFLNDTNKTNDDPDKNNTRNILYRCFYGDGDLLANTRTALTVFIDIADVLDKTAPLTASIQAVPDSQEISNQETLIINYGSGLVPDGAEATTDLNKLNSYTNGNSCSPVKDKWVLNSQSCTSSDGYIFKATDSANLQVTQQTCIGFDAWGSKDITQRYSTQHFASCSAPTTTVQAFVTSFVQSRTAVSSLFTSLKSGITVPPSSFDNIKSSNKLFMDDVRAYTMNEVTPYRTAYDPLYQPLSNQTNGLIPNCNCSFVRNSFRDLEQKLCIRFTPILFQILIAMIIISFMGSFGALMLFCLAKRFVVDTKGKYESVNKF